MNDARMYLERVITFSDFLVEKTSNLTIQPMLESNEKKIRCSDCRLIFRVWKSLFFLNSHLDQKSRNFWTVKPDMNV